MHKFKYLKISSNKKIRILSLNTNSNLYLVFLHGFKSDIEGNKPITFYNYCKKNQIGFLAPEYMGHGKSYGKFEKGNISLWSKDTYFAIKKIIKKKNFILIGSSMGGWIALNQFQYYKKQIKGFIGIGAAPEFLERLMWKKFTKKIKKELIKNKIFIVKKDNYEYPISLQLIKDGSKNKFFSKKIKEKIHLTMIHGEKDEAVPTIFSKKILKIFPNAIKKLKIIKNGDHALSSKKNLKIILKELNLIIKKSNLLY